MEKPKKTAAELEQMLQEAVDPGREVAPITVLPLGGGAWKAGTSFRGDPSAEYNRLAEQKLRQSEQLLRQQFDLAD